MSDVGFCIFCKSSSDAKQDWHYNVPEVMYAMIYILSVVLCLAVGVMLAYHLWSIASENHRSRPRTTKNIAEKLRSGAK
jgi:palmitoyltransferase